MFLVNLLNTKYAGLIIEIGSIVGLIFYCCTFFLMQFLLVLLIFLQEWRKLKGIESLYGRKM